MLNDPYLAGKNPVVDGEVSTIEIQRAQPDMGISIVGGCDTALVRLVEILCTLSYFYAPKFSRI